jgi:uncharacterized FlaG/YvyC family protein
MSVIDDKVLSIAYVPVAEKKHIDLVNNISRKFLVDSFTEKTVKELNVVDVTKKLDVLVSEVNNELSKTSNSLAFKVDSASGRNIYSLIDLESREVVKQYPTADFLRVSNNIKEYLEANVVENKIGYGVGNLLSSVV